MKHEEMLAATGDRSLWRLIGALWISEVWHNAWLVWGKPRYRAMAVVRFDQVLTHQEDRARGRA